MTTENREGKGRTIGYWIATALVALGFFAGGAMDIARGPSVQGIMNHLGYPAYFPVILGAWKLVGAIAIVVPRFPRLKEWAYAGMFFDLSGAVASHLSIGDGLSAVITPVVLVALVVTSWALRPSSRVLGAVTGPVPIGPERRAVAA